MSYKDNNQKPANEDFALPQNMIHLTRISWDPSKGFEMDDPQLKQFFDKAGVKECDLQDPQKREFIYDFIVQNRGLKVKCCYSGIVRVNYLIQYY